MNELIQSGKKYHEAMQEQRAIKDSGERTEYSTGAVRDLKEGKGRFDLMPLDVLSKLLGNEDTADKIILCVEAFKVSADVDCLYHAIGIFARLKKFEGLGNEKSYISNAMLEVAKHFEQGANKYGENNWRKGIPVHSYIDSAVRHYVKYKAGWTDEPHDRAFLWNLMCCIWTMEHKPELDDFTEEKHEPAND